MANYKKEKSKRKGSSCKMCKPWKRKCVKKRKLLRGAADVHGYNGLRGPWGAEARSYLNEKEWKQGDHD